MWFYGEKRISQCQEGKNDRNKFFGILFPFIYNIVYIYGISLVSGICQGKTQFLARQQQPAFSLQQLPLELCSQKTGQFVPLSTLQYGVYPSPFRYDDRQPRSG